MPLPPLTDHRPLRPGSYAWCGDCRWRDDTPMAHVAARLHTDLWQHVTHVYEPDD